MKTDVQIKDLVLEELAFQPTIDETKIDVSVKNGFVTLSGELDNYYKKLAAENAVKKVYGVQGIHDNIKVMYPSKFKRTDSEIKKAVTNAFEWSQTIPSKKIKTEIKDGFVFLTGELPWAYQKLDATKAIENLMGVRGITNNIMIKPTVEPFQIKDKINRAFERSADIDSKNIKVFVEGNKVKLEGKVHSLFEKDEALMESYFAPGVHKVENELEIAY